MREPIITPGRAPQSGPVPLQDQSAAVSVSRGLEGLASGLEQVARGRSEVYAAKALADARRHWTEEMIRRQEGAEGEAAGFAQGFGADFDAYMEEAVSMAPAMAKDRLTVGLSEIGGRLGVDALTFEATRRVAHRSDMALATIDQEVNTVLSAPDLFGPARENVRSLLDGAGLPAGVTRKLKVDAESRLAKASLTAMLRTDPGRVLSELDSGKWDGLLEPSDKLALINAARPEFGRALGREAWAASSEDFATAAATGDFGKMAEAVMPALVQRESAGDPTAVSPKGAMGLAQLMPDTAKQVARDLGIPLDMALLTSDTPEGRKLNLRLGQEYLRQQLETYDGNIVLALAAYNAGPGRVDEWIEKFGDPRTGFPTSEQWAAHIPFKETREYVPAILGRMGRNAARVRVATIEDPVVQRHAEAEVAQQEARHAVEAERFMSGFDDELAALAYGRNIPPTKFTHAALIDALGPEKGQEAWDRRQQAEESGRIFRSIALAPEAEVQAMRSRLEAQTHDPVGFQDAVRQLEAFDRAVATREKAIAEDPAAYVVANSPAVKAARGAEEPNPEAIAAMQMSAQWILGVKARDRRVLQKAEAAEIVAQLNEAPSAEAGDRLLAMEAQWGDHFGAVRAELADAGMDPGYYIASLYTDDPALMQQIVERTRAGKELEKGLEVTDLKRSLAEGLAPWRQAFEAGSPGSAAEEWNRLSSAMEAWAIGELRAGRSDAATAAVSRFMDSKWLLFDESDINAMIPRQVNGRPLEYSVVEDGLEGLRQEEAIRAFRPDTIGPEGIPLEDGTQGYEDTIRAAVNHGVWLLNEAGDGMVLTVPASTDGLGRPVPGVMLPLMKDGRPYEVKLTDIPAAAEEWVQEQFSRVRG